MKISGTKGLGFLVGLATLAWVFSSASATEQQQAIMGNQQLLGVVQSIKADQIQVDTGEVQPRFIPLKEAREKGFEKISPGDTLEITINDQNLLVDYHPVDETGRHHIVKGQISQPLAVGHDRATIRTEAGEEKHYPIRSQVRSKMASIPVGIDAVFLLDETDKIIDVNFRDKGAVEHAQQRPGHIKSPIKGSQTRVLGTVVEPLKQNRITIRTADGKEKPFEVRPLIHEKLAKLSKGERIVLLLDEDNMVSDIALPPSGQPHGEQG